MIPLIPVAVIAGGAACFTYLANKYRKMKKAKPEDNKKKEAKEVARRLIIKLHDICYHRDTPSEDQMKYIKHMTTLNEAVMAIEKDSVSDADLTEWLEIAKRAEANWDEIYFSYPEFSYRPVSFNNVVSFD